MSGLDRLNAMSADDARAALLGCCGSGRWAEAMTGRRPFASRGALLAAADGVWAGLSRNDRLEAFSHHPRIGATDIADERARREQSGVDDAPDDVRAALARGNDAYFERFGYVFLVCAAGRSAASMLEELRTRLGHDPEHELQVAAEEQRRITRLRLEHLVR